MLPLCGAEMHHIFEDDMVLVHTIMTNLCEKYSWARRNMPSFGRTWFVARGRGDYRGRVDNADYPTVWPYNSVRDKDGLGAVAMWYGMPTRLSKVSNLMVGYASELVGVNDFFQWIAQSIGTSNDVTADLSWLNGTLMAVDGNIPDRGEACSKLLWQFSDEKTKRLWPNYHDTDNYISSPTNSTFNYNFNFTSPGMIRKGKRMFRINN